MTSPAPFPTTAMSSSTDPGASGEFNPYEDASDGASNPNNPFNTIAVCAEDTSASSGFDGAELNHLEATPKKMNSPNG